MHVGRRGNAGHISAQDSGNLYTGFTFPIQKNGSYKSLFIQIVPPGPPGTCIGVINM